MHYFRMATPGAEHIPLWPQRDGMDPNQESVALDGLYLFVVAGDISKNPTGPTGLLLDSFWPNDSGVST